MTEVETHFKTGAESVTLTHAQWLAIYEVMEGYGATGMEKWAAEREAERVKRIMRPVWRACSIVARQMRKSFAAKPSQVRDWEMRLRHSMQVSWQNLPAGHALLKNDKDWR